MKTFMKGSVLGLLLTVFVSVSAVSVYAQDPMAELYQKFTDQWASTTMEGRKSALATAKEFVEKYGTVESVKAQVDYLKDQAIPYLEDTIAKDKKAEDERRAAEALRAKRAKMLSDFDAAFVAKDWQKLFDVGQSILNERPEFYDIAVVMASVGFDQAIAKNDTFNDKAIQHAKFAIAKLEKNEKPVSESCAGTYFIYNTKEFPNCVPNTLGFMNYYIGYIMYTRQKKEDAAMSYLQKAASANSGAKNQPELYRTIGKWYLLKMEPITAKRETITTERNAAVAMATPDVEQIKNLDIELDRLEGLEKGYADRAIDAYSRAYSVVSPTDKAGNYGKDIFGWLQKLYKFRYYDTPELQTDAQINMNVSTIGTKAMPDTSSAVQPVLKTTTESGPATNPDATKSGGERTRTVSQSKSTSKNNQ